MMIAGKGCTTEGSWFFPNVPSKFCKCTRREKELVYQRYNYASQDQLPRGSRREERKRQADEESEFECFNNFIKYTKIEFNKTWCDIVPDTDDQKTLYASWVINYLSLVNSV